MNAQIDISNVVLTTERLTLRPWRESDLTDFYGYASVEGVGQMAGWLPHKTIEESRGILERFIQGKKTFAIEYNKQVIGSIGIELYNEKNFPEFETLQGRSIGYVLSKVFWGQGIMPEAVQAVIRYVFSEVGLDFVLISHFHWNRQSARVIEKCGLTFLKESIHETSYGTKEITYEHILYNPVK